jgi:hypothetical protein
MKLINDYIPVKMPDGFSIGILFSSCHRKQLDVYGEWYKAKRRKFWFIKELDCLYKIRLINQAIEYANGGVGISELLTIKVGE